MGRRILWAALGTLLALGSLPGPALAHPSNYSPRSSAGNWYHPDPFHSKALAQLERFGAPAELLDIFSGDEEVAETGRSLAAWPGNDLAGNGRTEVFEHLFRWRLTYDPSTAYLTGFSQEAQTKITIRDSRSGSRLWSKKFDDYAVAVPARVGRSGKPGAMIFSGLLSFFGPAEDRYLVIDAVDGRGKAVWSWEIRATSVGTGFANRVAVNTPIQVALFDGVKGRATDVIVGVANYASTLAGYTVASQAHLIDGRSGDAAVHPTVDVGVNWLPTPDPVGDLDADGLEDYIVATNPGLDPGGPQEPPAIGGTIDARKSTDGTSLWTTGNLTMHDFELTFPVPDVAGDATRDIAIMTPVAPQSFDFRTYLLDGSNGFLRWDRLGGWPLVPGDIDRDRRPDILLHDVLNDFDRERHGFRQTAVNHRGEKLWSRRHVATIDPGICTVACFGWAFHGLTSFGRLTGDEVAETFLSVTVEKTLQDTNDHIWIVDGKSGRSVFEAGLAHSPAGSLDGSGPDLVHVEVTTEEVGLTAVGGYGTPQLWRSRHEFPRRLLQAQEIYGYAQRIDLRNNRCSDLIVSGRVDDYSYYGVVEGGSGRILWARKTGEGHAPRTVDVTDSNPAC